MAEAIKTRKEIKTVEYREVVELTLSQREADSLFTLLGALTFAPDELYEMYGALEKVAKHTSDKYQAVNLTQQKTYVAPGD